MAFEEVCPERIDLIHKNYRKLCNLLIDVEEWGQVVIISMLTRYARTQFLSPTQNVSAPPGPALARRVGRRVAGRRRPLPHPSPQQESLLEENPEKAFYGSEEDEAKGPGSEEAAASALPARKPYVMDPDHRLLLRNTKPLLQSRSAAVVMAVAQLYFHLAPKAEVGVIAKALVRLLRSHRCVPAPPTPSPGPAHTRPWPRPTSWAHQAPPPRPSPLAHSADSSSAGVLLLVTCPPPRPLLSVLGPLFLRPPAAPCPCRGAVQRLTVLSAVRCSTWCSRTWPPCPSSAG